MVALSDLILKIRAYDSKFDENLLKRAYILAKGAHGNQKRHSGELYFSHPVAVAEILIDLKLDISSIIAALLHDVVEDTDISLQEIEEQFGSEVAQLVDGVTKLSKLGAISTNEKIAENFRKLTMAMSQDIRVLLVKLADRLHNMRTIFYVPSKEKKIKKARECIDIYAPIAGRIGLDKIKNELEDIAFSVIDPKSRNHINNCLDELRQKNKNLIEKIINHLEAIFAEEGIECKIQGREKKPYSIWLNMKKKNVGFHNLHDIIAFRIITKSMIECYKVLGYINLSFNMIPGSFKDYISTPKDNGYQAIHIVSLGPFNKKIEIQICDEAMYEVAENGVASHWYYKEKFSKNNVQFLNPKFDLEQYKWIRELISLFESSENASDVIRNYEFNTHKNDVFCFTPEGDIFNLPFGSTALDFAYEVHSEIGNSCSSAKINGVIAPLRRKIENGDQIEIITSKTAKPNPTSLQYVFTSKAKAAIKNYLKKEKYDEYTELGKAILKRYFELKFQDFDETIIEKCCIEFQVKNISDLYFRIADGTISKVDVFKFLNQDIDIKVNSIASSNDDEQSQIIDPTNYIDGLVTGMSSKFCDKCLPIIGDEILGVADVGNSIEIHRQNCSHLKKSPILNKNSIDLKWKENIDVNDKIFLTKIFLLVENSVSNLGEVSNILLEQNIEVKNMAIVSKSDNYYELVIEVMVANIENLENIISALILSNKIIEVNRIDY